MRDAYREYKQDTIDSNGKVRPSIKSLDDKWGMKWRGSKSTSEGKYYARREPLWKAVATIVKEGVHSEATVLLTVREVARQANTSGAL